MNAEEFAQQQREQAVAGNDAWHHRNIENYLRTHLDYCRDANAIGASKSISEYAEAESKRLRERATLMEKYGIASLPNVHGELAVSLLSQAKVYCDANAQRDRERLQEASHA